MTYELMIKHDKTLYFPSVVDGATVEWERQGQPGKLSFDVVQTGNLTFEEGDPCRFSVNGEVFFYGFVFKKSISGKTPEVINVTVYDQLYYLKNKDTYIYADKTASEVVKMIAEDFGLNLGELDDTGYKIETRTEEDTELSDIIQNALDITVKAKTEMYVLYDKAGKLMLTNIAKMKLGIVIDKNKAADFDYKSSIADNTYNRIKLVHEDNEAGTRQVYIAQDGSNINKWGVLQYYEKLNDAANAKATADSLLKLYNTKSRSLSISDVLGDTRVRAGTMLVVVLEISDEVSLANYLLVEQVKHTFRNGQHLMDLKMRGGQFGS